ncbi:MAG: glycosyltransferase [bacterium]|nr:glycosyltransferase [bacterium]
MKILAISNFYPPYYMGGYELRAQNILNGLKRRGHKVFVLTSTYGINKISIKENVYRIFNYKHKFPISFMETLLEEIKETREFKKVIKKLQPDLIYVFNMRFMSKSLLKKAYSLKIPVVYDIGDYWLIDNSLWGKWLDFWQYSPRFFITRFIKLKLSGVVKRLNITPLLPVDVIPFDKKYIYFVSEFVKNVHIKKGLGVKDASVFHHGLNMGSIVVRENKGFVSLPLKLLYVGAVIHNKGVHTIVDALSILKQKGYDCHLTIVGGIFDTEYLNKIKLLIGEENLPVTFLGQYPHNKVLRMYKDYDILVFSSIWDEPFGRVIVEAMAAGLVVLATATGGSMEVLNDGENCILFEPGNSEDLANKIEILRKKPELCERLSSNGKEFAKDFDKKNDIKKIEDYLYGVVKNYKA